MYSAKHEVPMQVSHVLSCVPVAQKVEQSALQPSTQVHLASASQSFLELPPQTIVFTRSPAATACEQVLQRGGRLSRIHFG
jgi:hypothetical protein